MSYPTPPEWQPTEPEPYEYLPQSAPPDGQPTQPVPPQPSQPGPYGYLPQSAPPDGQPTRPVSPFAQPYGQLPQSVPPYAQPTQPVPPYPQRSYPVPYPAHYPQPIPGASPYPPGQGPYGHAGPYSVTRDYIGPGFHLVNDAPPPATGGLLAPNRVARRILVPRSRARDEDPLISVLAVSRSVIGVALVVALLIAANYRGPTGTANATPVVVQTWRQQMSFYVVLALASLLFIAVLALLRPSTARRLIGPSVASVQVLIMYGVLVAIAQFARSRATVTTPSALFLDEAVAAILIWVSLVVLAAQTVYIPQNFFRSAEGHPLLSPLLSLVAATASFFFVSGGNLPAPAAFARVIGIASFVSNVALAVLELWRIRRPLPHNGPVTRWADRLVRSWSGRTRLTRAVAQGIGYSRLRAGMTVAVVLSMLYATINTLAMMYDPGSTSINPGFYNNHNLLPVAGLNVGVVLVPLLGLYFVRRFRLEGVWDSAAGVVCHQCHGARTMTYANQHGQVVLGSCVRCNGQGTLDSLGRPHPPAPRLWSNAAVAWLFVVGFVAMCCLGSALGNRVGLLIGG